MSGQHTGIPATGGDYTLPNEWELARQRLTSLEAAYDATTVRRLDVLGVGPGWRCLEIGAGAGSIARRLAERAGSNGRVVATDLDVRLLDPLADEPNVEVRALDLRVDPLPRSSFDLVHSRLVLGHIPEREQILDRLVASLRPGGWLLLEEADDFSLGTFGTGLHPTVLTTHMRAIARGGFAPDWGRDLPVLLEQRGLADVDAECEVPLHRGGSPALEWLRLTFAQMGGPTGDAVLPREVMRTWNDLLDRPDQWFAGLGLVAARGRRPG